MSLERKFIRPPGGDIVRGSWDYERLGLQPIKIQGMDHSNGQIELHPVVIRDAGNITISYTMCNPCGIPEEDYSLPLRGVRQMDGSYDIHISGKKVGNEPDEAKAKAHLERFIDKNGNFIPN